MVIDPVLLQQELPHMGADQLRDVVQSLFKTLTRNADVTLPLNYVALSP